MFEGSTKLTLDDKGRIAMPSKYRPALKADGEGQLTITRDPHGCLLLFPRPVWLNHRTQIAAWPISAKAWQRIFLGSADNVDMDGSGRVLISPELRAAAGIEKNEKVMLLGMGSHFEIWNEAKLEKSETAAIEQGMPDVLTNFSF